jgi:phage terminase small subunit
MKAPAGLGAAGKKAWERALRAIENADDEDLLYDRAANYAFAVDRGDKARQMWRREGEPLLVTPTKGPDYAHPLLKVMDDADKAANRFAKELKIEAPGKQKHRGPDPKAVVQPDIGSSPAAKLRAVK